ncbi:MAG: class I SAM-dependent methyltransferase [Chloroflexi bacterium]|nr:class I SAM-dependent methyltransferase [Chloroflexota bacterium]
MYDQIAHYYELTHAALDDDIAWVLATAARLPSPILELGCGSGRLLLPLAQAGHTIVGVDNSAAMLAIAQRKLATCPADVQARTTLHHADMLSLDLPQRDFGLALIPYNTIMHIPPPALGRVLRAIHAHLRPGGWLAIDTINPLWLAETADSPAPEEEQTFTDPSTGETVTQYATYRAVPAQQEVHILWQFVAEGTAEPRQTTAEAIYHYTYPHQFQLALAEAGFHLRQIMGDYDGNPFDEESERLLLLSDK